MTEICLNDSDGLTKEGEEEGVEEITEVLIDK